MRAAVGTTMRLRGGLTARVHPAVRLGALVLGVVGAFALPVPAVAANLAVLAVVLARTGLGPAQQARTLGPWWPTALLVLGIHVLTTTAAAPLGHPSWAGLAAGLAALARVACSLGWFVLFWRTVSLDDVVQAAGWWLRPLGRFGVHPDDLGLVLAVAAGTTPQVMDEGRRALAVVQLRRHGPGSAGRGWWRRALDGTADRVRLAGPLLEGLGRRADTLGLALRHRHGAAPPAPAVGAGQLVLLALWAAALVAATLAARGGAA